MLVLTRKRTEKILIGEDVVITVIHTSSGSVKLGIQAPANVRVLRAELDERPVTMDLNQVSPNTKEPANAPVFSADRYQFDLDYVADLEDQVLTCLAK